MKRTLTVLLLLVCMLFGCSSTPQEKAGRALQKTAELKGMDLYLTGNFVLKGAESEEKIALNSRLQIKDLEKDSLQMNATSTVERNGTKRSVSVYRTGEWFYVTDNSTSYKSYLADLVGGYDYAAVVRAVLREYPQTVWDNATYNEDEVVLALDLQMLTERFGALAERAWNTLVPEGSADISGGSLTMKFSGKYVTACTLTLVQTGADMTLESSIVLNWNALGGDVAVSPPNGYQNFPEYNFS